MANLAQDDSINEPTEVVANEDAETRATRRELKQSSISDASSAAATANGTSSDEKIKDQLEATGDDAAREGDVMSIKKKRAHDQLEGETQPDENDAHSTTSTDSAKDRASRQEPEKKRHRDGEAEEDKLPLPETKAEEVTGISPTKKDPQTSSSAFASSGFGSLAAAPSPFASFGKSTGGGGFGSAGTAKLSSFASPNTSAAAQPVTAPKLAFGTGAGASPFAGLSSASNGFGSRLGGDSSGLGAFGSASSGSKLTSFAAPQTTKLKSEKPSRPFGAPESDAEEDGDEGEGDEVSQSGEDRGPSPEKEVEEPKKSKLQRIEVDDGEAGEATILSVRGKMYYHEKDEGWKERGAGMLKINAPQSCIEFDDSGVAIPGSFDASGLDLDEEEGGEQHGHKIVRLLMRQDQTHRVILNTAIGPLTKFQEQASLKSVSIIFTAHIDGQPKPCTVKLSAANAKLLMNEISVIQRELSNN